MNQRISEQPQIVISALSYETILQRTCACGQHTTAGGECEECRKKRENLQRAAVNDAPVNEIPGIVREVLQTPGQPLDPATRADLEPRFGQDFSRVRVHTGSQAAQSAQAVNALAYTMGQDLVFDSGRYAPQTTEGQRLLAHELTHTIQQNGAAAGYAAYPNRVGPPGSPGEQEAERSAAEVMAGRAVQVRPGSASPEVARVLRETRTLHEGTREIDVSRVVTAGRCARVPAWRTSASADLRDGRGFFQATACRGGTEGSVSGEVDFSRIIEGFGNFVSGAPGAVQGGPQGLQDLASRTLGQAETRAQVRFVLRLNTFRAELGGSTTATGEGGVQSGQVDGVLRYTNGQFRIELTGQHRELLQALERGQDTNVSFGTDVGPVEVRLRGSRTARDQQAGQDQTYVFDGSVSYRLGGQSIGGGVNIEQSLPPNGSPNTQVIFSVRINTGGQIRQETAPDCFTCECQNPQIEFQCVQHTPQSPGDQPPPAQPLYLPLYFEYAQTTPRPGWERGYQDMLAEIVRYIREGYTIARIDGFTSPEGPLGPRPGGRFEGNVRLAEARAAEALSDIRAALQNALNYSIFNETINERWRNALSATPPTAGQAELFGSRPAVGEVPARDLFTHLTTTLAAPGQADPLEEARVTGSSLPESVRNAAAEDVEAFRTGQRGNTTLTRSQRLQALYRNLRRALVVLNPPRQAARPVGLLNTRLPQSTIESIIGTPIDCTEAHKAVFNNVRIPPEAMFDDRCSTVRRPGQGSTR